MPAATAGGPSGSGPRQALSISIACPAQGDYNYDVDVTNQTDRIAALETALRRALSFAHDAFDGTRHEPEIEQLEAVLRGGEPAPAAPPELPADLGRDAAIAFIRSHLRARSGKAWSVSGGRGTAWGWITITAPPRRRQGGSMTDADRAELATLLGEPVRGDGASVPASSDHYREYCDRAAGVHPPRVIGQQYWD